MSIPPQVIRVKRKRVEEAPLRFLQFAQQKENQRSSIIWAYQRRAGALKPAADAFLQGQRPVIHASKSDDVASPCKKRHKESPHQESGKNVESGIRNRTDGCEPWEPRRFHIARSPRSRNNSLAIRATISKRTKSTPALFVERDGKKRRCHRLKESRTMLEAATRVEIEAAMPSDVALQTAEERRLKRPGVAHRIKNRDKQGKDDRKHRPLPQSLMNRHPGDMENVAADMNQWVMNEIGANLKSMEREKLRQQHWQKLKFRPKAPAQRCHQSHEEPTRASQVGDVVMTEVGDASDESDDWIIDEYVRIPANSVATGVSRADIGILVLDEKEENMLFFGPMDDDDYENEDEDDENAENHYTADYPEDDLESDDAYGRWPYDYCNGMISDDKEFDQVYDSGVDDADDGLPFGDAEGYEDEARMARLKASVRRHTAL